MKNKKNFSVVPDTRERENNKTGVTDTNKITDIDSMLKDHLKASINMERLEVSEDLVQRTLQKIKQSEMNTASDDNNRKEQYIRNRNKSLRGLVGAAAAIVLVVASVTVWQSGIISGGNNGSQVKGIDQTAPNAEMDIMGTSPVTESGEGDKSDYSIMSESAGTPEIDMATKNTEDSTVTEGFTSDTNAVAESSEVTPDSGNTSITLLASNVFSENYSLESFKDVSAFLVTKEYEKPVNVTDKAVKAEELYSILDQYAMSELTDSLGDDWIYKADIKAAGSREIIVYIWESGNIAVSDKTSDKTSDNDKTYYTLDNGTEFFKKFSEFYMTLN